MSMYLIPAAGALKAIAILAAGYLVLKRGSRKRTTDTGDEAPVDDGIDHETLARAEAEVSETFEDQRGNVSEGYELWWRLPTLNGRSSEEVRKLCDFLESRDVKPVVLFESSLAPGAARRMRPEGVFEIHVPAHELDRMAALLEEFDEAARS